VAESGDGIVMRRPVRSLSPEVIVRRCRIVTPARAPAVHSGIHFATGTPTLSIAPSAISMPVRRPVQDLTAEAVPTNGLRCSIRYHSCTTRPL
jgi:hypothetical protein